MTATTIITTIFPPPDPPAGAVLTGYHVIDAGSYAATWEERRLGDAVCTWIERGKDRSILYAVADLDTPDGSVRYLCEWTGRAWMPWRGE